jgi:hypothetical protein
MFKLPILKGRAIESRMKYGPKLKRKHGFRKRWEAQTGRGKLGYSSGLCNGRKIPKVPWRARRCACVCVLVWWKEKERERESEHFILCSLLSLIHPSKKKKKTTHLQCLLTPAATCAPCQQSTWIRSQGYPRAKVVPHGYTEVMVNTEEFFFPFLMLPILYYEKICR